MGVVRQSDPQNVVRPTRQPSDLTSQIELFRYQLTHRARKRGLSWEERQALEELIQSIAKLLSLTSW